MIKTNSSIAATSLDASVKEKLANNGIKDFLEIENLSFATLFCKLKTFLNISEIQAVVIAFTAYLNAKKCNMSDVVKLLDDVIMYDNKIVKVCENYIIEDIAIEDLHFRERTYKRLKSINVATLSDLLTFSERELLLIPNLGRTGAAEICDLVIKYVQLKANQENYVIKTTDNQTEPQANDLIQTTHNQVETQVNHDYEGISIDILTLSNQTVNSLKKVGIVHVGQLMNFDRHIVAKISNLGQQSLEEIEQAMSHFFDNEKQTKDNNDIEEEYKEAYAQQESKITDKSMILNHIRENGLIGGTIEEISLAVFDSLNYQDCKAILDSLVKEEKVEIINNNYREKRQSIVDMLSVKQDDRNSKIALDRLNGQKLEDIGNNNGITRERARQIIKKTINDLRCNSTGIRRYEEDWYKYIFTTYDFNIKSWQQNVDGKKTTYNYLLNCYNKGNADTKLMKNDIKVPYEIRRRVDEYNKLAEGKYIVVDDMRLHLNKGEIEDYILKKYCIEEKTIEEFFQIYNSFLREQGISNDSNLYTNEDNKTTRINRITALSFVLWKMNMKLRYYPMDVDFTELLEKIDLSQYHEQEISTQLIIDQNHSLMKKYDIRDKYELHNLLKKICSPELNPGMVFKRMPIIAFSINNNYSRDKYVFDILCDFAPITQEKFADVLVKKTGIEKRIILANWLGCINSFLEKGVYSNPIE